MTDTTPEAVKLLPCELCGGQGRVVNDGDPSWPWVVVWNHNHLCPTGSYGYATEAEAITAWNTRLSARTPSAGAGEALRASLEEHSTALVNVSAALQQSRYALEWYGEQARLCRLIHSEGDAGRAALSDDGGKRARAVLSALREGPSHE